MRRSLARVATVIALVLLPADAVSGSVEGEQTVVDPTSFDVATGDVTTPALEAGRTYRLLVGRTFNEVGPNVTFTHDAAYCFDDNSTIGICRGDPSPSDVALFAGYEGSSASPFYELAGTDPPAYADTHFYELFFVAGQSRSLRFSVNKPDVDRDYQGHLELALYLEPAGAGPAAATPLDHTPASGEPVSYPVPPNGKTEVAKGPEIPNGEARVRMVAGGGPGELLLGMEPGRENNEHAKTLCAFAYLGGVYDDAVSSTPLDDYRRCRQAVAAVLARCELLRATRKGPGVCGGPTRRTAITSQQGCTTAVVGLKGSKHRPRLRARCSVSATGTTVTLRPRRKHGKLRKVLGRHIKLVMGSPVAGPPVSAGDRLNLVWTVSR
jgi:hypothetical protein